MVDNSDTEPLIVNDEESGLRLDRLLVQRYPDQSRTYFQYLIEHHLVLLNGNPSKKRVLVKEGDEVEVEFALTPEISLQPEAIPLEILYEDEWLLAINKPAGLVVHPAPGHWSGTFVNALLFHCQALPSSTENPLRPGIVHRLDKDTSGILLAAKTEKAQQNLVAAFAAKEMEKEYLAICIGRPAEGLIETRIGRHLSKRKEMAAFNLHDSKGKQATTYCQVLTFNGQFSVVKLQPRTGRTHQLRVHLNFLKAPILGDSLYGNSSLNKKYAVERQLLHAHRLCFSHPITKKPMELIAPIPHDIQLWIQKVEKTERK